jgi:hypothetical protein
MLKVTVDDACSFARSFDERTGDPDRFIEETAAWFAQENPVLAQLVYQMAAKLSGGDVDAANTCLAVAGYGLRLLDHASCNRHVSFSICGGECGQEHRRLCCQKRDDAGEQPLSWPA